MRRTGFIFLILVFFTTHLSAQIIDHWEMILQADDTWKYHVGTSAPSSSWSQKDFNDDLWNSGTGGFGYGDDDDGTVISNASSVFLRIKFDIEDLSQIEKVVLLCDYDDAFVAYINNEEVGRSGISGNPPSFDQFADSQHEASRYQGQYPEEVMISKSQLTNLLTDGENTLAIQVHNINATSSDLSSNFFLTVALNTNSSVYRPIPSWFREPLEYTSSNLPLIKINTSGKVIPDEPKIQAHMSIIDNGPGQINYIDDPATDYNGTIGIEIRGSSSQMFPKKQYAVELWTDAGIDTSASVLGLPAEEDWVLYAPYSDKSLLRNVLAYKFSSELGWYAPRTKLVEVYINDQYKGIYVLTEKIKRDVNRVNVSKLNLDENSGDDLTGGYIVKIDKFDGATEGLGWNSPIPPPNHGNGQVVHFQYHYPKEDEITNEQAEYIENYITEFEESLDGPLWKHPEKGYCNYINVESFIDFSIINEITKNVDGYRLSTFIHKDKDSKDKKLYLGPVWDFNLGFGNANYCEGGTTDGWAWDFNKRCNGDYWLVPFWWERLLKDQEYKMQLKSRWQEVRADVLSDDAILTYIDSVVTVIDDAQQRNFTQWPILNEYIWPNNNVGGSYTNEVLYLKNWIADRMSWLDNAINDFELITDIEDLNSFEQTVKIFPNPGNGHFNIQFDNKIYEAVSLKIFNQLGELIMDKQLNIRDSYSQMSNTLNFNFSSNPGVYLLKVSDPFGLVYLDKLIIN